jgi:carboxypeptidase family protein
MKQSIFRIFPRTLIILGVSIVSQAQIAKTEYNSSDRYVGGWISGTILDQTGAVSVGANIRLTLEGQSSNREVQSGNNGEFAFSNVAPGAFRLTVGAAGFLTKEFSAVLRPGETYIVPPISLFLAPTLTEIHVKLSLTPVQVADLQIKEQEMQRVLGIIPNFYVSYEGNALPLNPKQKFSLAWKTTTDPFTFLGVAALAGVEQATKTFNGYGQGAEGYFKRLGASYTDVLTGTYIGSAVLPSVMKQDPRYFYKGTGSTRSRFLYALASPIICKGDNNRWQPNYSNVGGAFASAGISYLYYPASDRKGAGLVVQNSLVRLGEIAFEGVLQEFVIRRLTPHVQTRVGSAVQQTTGRSHGHSVVATDENGKPPAP